MICWICSASATITPSGPMCLDCRKALARLWLEHGNQWDDFSGAGMDKGHAWYMQHPCTAALNTDQVVLCWCGRELMMPSITPRWETELSEILQRLGVQA